MNTKKVILGAALTLATVGAMAQGTITFNNDTTSYVMYNGVAAPFVASGANAVKIELFYQPNSGGAAPTALTVNNLLSGTTGNWEALSPVASIKPGSNAGLFQSSETTGSDVAPNGNVWLTAVAWNGGYSTYAAASAGSGTTGFQYAITTVWSQATGGGGVPTTTAVPTAGNFGTITLVPVPEPTTIALAGLGAASLLLFRRRK